MLSNEVRILEWLNYNNVSHFGFPKIIKIFKVDAYSSTVINLQGVSLKEFLTERFGCVSEQQIYTIVTQLVNRVEKLHEFKCVHGNLSLDTIYVQPGEFFRLIISDFYYSSLIQSKDKNNNEKELKV